jgi:hypothetical protein
VNELGQEFLKALREAPRMYFAPLVAAWRAMMAEAERTDSEHGTHARTAHDA